MKPMTRTVSHRVVQALARLAVGSLLLFLAAPAHAEGEHWVPLYNKLARMLNERCTVAGESTVSLLQPSATVSQNDLEVLRAKVIYLATNKYVIQDTGSWDGGPPTRKLFEYVLVNGQHVQDAHQVDILRSPSIFSLAELPCPNAFTRIPAGYGCESYALSFTTGPVLWEHFGELYKAIMQLGWTCHTGEWKSGGETNMASPQMALGSTWSAATQWMAAQWVPTVALDTAPGVRVDAQYFQGQPVPYVLLCHRSYAYFAVTLPSSALPGEEQAPPEHPWTRIAFYSYAETGNITNDDVFNAFGDTVEESTYTMWDAYQYSSTTIAGRLDDGVFYSGALGDTELTEPLVGDPSTLDPPSIFCGYAVTSAYAIMQWTFTPWESVSPTTVPPPTSPPPPDPPQEGVCVGCMGCTPQTCQIDAQLNEQGNPASVTLLGMSDASGAGPSILAYLSEGGTTMPHTGLSVGSPAEGTLTSFSLDTQVVSDHTIDGHRFVNILRPRGRTVTYHFAPSATHGKPVGVDAANAGSRATGGGTGGGTSQALYDRGNGVLELVFTDSGSAEVTIHQFTGGALTRVTRGTSSEEGESTVGQPGAWPGLTWSGNPLNVMSSWMHNLRFTRNGGGRISDIVYESSDESAAELIKTQFSYTGAMMTGLEKFRKENGNWVSFDEASFTRDLNGKWTMERPGRTVQHETTVDQETGDETIVESRAQTGDTTARVTSITYHTYPWGREIVAHTSYDPAEYDPEEPDGKAPQIFSYYDDAENDSEENYGRLRQMSNPDGSWTQYTYEDGRVATETTGVGDTAPDDENGTARVTSYSYTPLANSGDDGSRAPGVPRTTMVTIGTQEVSRSYLVALANETRVIRCATAGAAWSATSNLVTVTETYASGDWQGHTRKVTNPDGTVTLFEYEVVQGGLMTTTWTGEYYEDEEENESVVDGTKSVTVVDPAGRTLLSETYDIASNLLLSSTEQNVFDVYGRPTRTDYLDGTFTTTVYACCGPDTVTDRDGIQTQYIYDDQKRVEYEIRAGITTHYIHDVDGNVTSTVRIGTDDTEIPLSTSVYDEDGRLVSTTDALDSTTTFSEAFSENGGMVKTTTYPDNATRIETYARDGSLLSVSGTGVHSLNYEYGADANGRWTKEIRIGANNAQTEWVKTYTDMLGRQYKTVYPDNAVSQSYFNATGQLVKQVDPDGVTTLYGYSAKGTQEYTAVDMNVNDQIDLTGTDRVTRNETSVLEAHNTTVRRSTTTLWTTNGNGNTVTAAVNDSSADGLQNWSTSFGLTAHSATVVDAENQTRTVTATAPDGSYTVSVTENGRPTSVTRYDADDNVLSEEEYSYDAHGRRSGVTDARNGETTFEFNDGDHVVSVTTPDPDGAGSQQAQVTSYLYDSRGHQTQVTQPDTTVVHMEYWPTGELKKTYGSRTYPVAHAYDTQGRMATLTTWQDYTGETGAAVTSWSYDTQRGFLLSKTYAGNTAGPAYTYTAAGRLLTRTWARGVTTTYAYNAAGDLASIDYSGTTPDITYTYDRMGRRVTATDGVSTQTTAYATSGEPVSDTWAGGPLDTVAVAWSYDNLHRRSGLAATRDQTSLGSTGYTYDDASRLSAVTSGANTATYAYQANSNLISTLTFNNGTADVLTTTKTNDKLNRLLSVSSVPTGASTVGYAYLYNTANQRIRATLADGSYWVYQYDSLGQVVAGQKYWQNDTAVGGMQFGYAFDDIGNRKTATTNGRQASYTTNLLNQYTQATVPGALDILGMANSAATVTINNQPVTRVGAYFSRTFTVNNATAPVWQAVNVVGVRNNVGANGEDTVTEEAGHRFLPQTPEAFTYDDDGNMTADGRWAYTWDGENRLVKMEAASGLPDSARRKVEFAYDGQSRRVEKKSYTWSGTAWVLASDHLFVYDGWNPIAELNAGDGSLVRKYCWGLDLSGSLQGAGGVGGLLSITSGAATQFTAYDGNGNVVALIDAATGAESAHYEYDPFGNTLVQTGAAAGANPFRFSTKYTDAETGLLYYGLRYYSPNQGRWISRDPIEEEGARNLYATCGNNSVSQVDLLGLRNIYQLSDNEGTLTGGAVAAEIRDAIAHILCLCPGYVELRPISSFSQAEVLGLISAREVWIAAHGTVVDLTPPFGSGTPPAAPRNSYGRVDWRGHPNYRQMLGLGGGRTLFVGPLVAAGLPPNRLLSCHVHPTAVTRDGAGRIVETRLAVWETIFGELLARLQSVLADLRSRPRSCPPPASNPRMMILEGTLSP